MVLSGDFLGGGRGKIDGMGRFGFGYVWGIQCNHLVVVVIVLHLSKLF